MSETAGKNQAVTASVSDALRLGASAIGFTIYPGSEYAFELIEEIRQHVATHIGPTARPKSVMAVSDLPKTRSGKIMRRILRKIAEGELGSLGDTSTLADPSVVESLIHGRK